MCEGVKKIEICFYKIKDSSTIWLIWLLSSKPCMTTFLSRKFNFSDQYPLNMPKIAFCVWHTSSYNIFLLIRLSTSVTKWKVDFSITKANFSSCPTFIKKSKFMVQAFLRSVVSIPFFRGTIFWTSFCI